MPQLRHGPRLDLADAFAGQVEMLAHLFQRARLAAVETETQPQDLALALVQRVQQSVNLARQQRRRRHLEGRLGTGVLDDVSQFGVAILPQRFGEAQRLEREAQGFNDLVLWHLTLDRQLGLRRRATQLELEANARLL